MPREGYKIRRANARARRHRGKGGCESTYRRGATLDVLRVALALRSGLARARGHGAAGRIGDVPGARVRRARGGAAPLRDATLRDRGKRGGRSERHGDARRRPTTGSRGFAKTSRGTSWIAHAPRHTPRRRDFASSSRRESGEGKVRGGLADTRANVAQAEGGRTHQASALGLLAEVVEQRGHVAEALGGILPAIRGAIRRRSVVVRSFSSVPQSRARSFFVASGSPKYRTRPVRWRWRGDGATRT